MSQKNKTFGETLAGQRRGGLLALLMPSQQGSDIDTMSVDPPASKKGSSTVPSMCGGGKVIKSWGK